MEPILKKIQQTFITFYLLSFKYMQDIFVNGINTYTGMYIKQKTEKN